MPTFAATDDTRESDIRFDSDYRGDAEDGGLEQFPNVDFGRYRRAELESTRSLQGHRDGVREAKKATAGCTYGDSRLMSEERLIPEMQ